MNAAVVDEVTGIVINVIVVDSVTDQAPMGSLLVEIPDGASVGPYQTIWSSNGGFLPVETTPIQTDGIV